MSNPHENARLARVLYRQCLRLLPRRFYAEYAGQMALDFDDLLQDAAREGGPFLVAATTARAFGDLVLSAARERIAMLHGEPDAAPVTPRVNAAVAIASSHEYQGCGLSADRRLLIGLATEQHGLAGIVLRELGVRPDRLRASFGGPERSAGHGTAVDGTDAAAVSVFDRRLTNAAEWARAFGHPYIGTEHLALSLLAETDGDAARLIERLGVDPKALRDVLAERTRASEPVHPHRFFILLLLVAAALVAGAVLSTLL